MVCLNEISPIILCSSNKCTLKELDQTKSEAHLGNNHNRHQIIFPPPLRHQCSLMLLINHRSLLDANKVVSNGPFPHIKSNEPCMLCCSCVSHQEVYAWISRRCITQCSPDMVSLLKLSVYVENQSIEMHLMNTCWPQRPERGIGPEY